MTSDQPFGSLWLGEAFRAQFLALVAPSAIRDAELVEQIHAAGRALGLTEVEITEVFNAWLAWYRERPDPVRLGRIRAAVRARAAGEEWRPPPDGPAVDPRRLNALLYELGIAPGLYTPAIEEDL